MVLALFYSRFGLKLFLMQGLFLNRSSLMDMELKGCNYTWVTNPRNGVEIKEKLDRVLVNVNLRLLFPNAIIAALLKINSNHSLIDQSFDNISIRSSTMKDNTFNQLSLMMSENNSLVHPTKVRNTPT